jgi:CO/xanthine dehydrogenase Mo-binding subunit
VASDLGCAPEQVRFRDDRVWGADDSASLSFEEAMRLMWQAQEYPYAFGIFQGPRVTWDEATGQGDAYFTWVYGCQAVELTVNRKTGRVKLLQAWAAHDIGRALNRPMLLGQFYGGMAMGIGYGLLEQVRMEGGKILSLNYDTYRIPRSTDMPEMHAHIVENRDPRSPSGAKGIGEPTNELMAPALANALAAATGRRFTRLPVSDSGVLPPPEMTDGVRTDAGNPAGQGGRG